MPTKSPLNISGDKWDTSGKEAGYKRGKSGNEVGNRGAAGRDGDKKSRLIPYGCHATVETKRKVRYCHSERSAAE